MNLNEILQDDFTLKQDNWSITNPKFGNNNQLTVVGWSVKCKSNNMYILKCGTCSKDPELFGEGYFKSLKSNLTKKSLPYGCASAPKWTEKQYYVLCTRKAKELGYEFGGFFGDWNGKRTKIKMTCKKHGDWYTGNIDNLINQGYGCNDCGNDSIAETSRKPDKEMIKSFFDTNCFHPKTEFTRSGRTDTYGRKVYWNIYCPECNEHGESLSVNLQAGKRPCGCAQG